jgi:hypothetical protein
MKDIEESNITEDEIFAELQQMATKPEVMPFTRLQKIILIAARLHPAVKWSDFIPWWSKKFPDAFHCRGTLVKYLSQFENEPDYAELLAEAKKRKV